MKKLLAILLATFICAATLAYAKGGASSGGGGHGGGGGHASASVSRGGFSSSSVSRPATTSTTTSTTTRTSTTAYSGRYVGGGAYYGGMGMGYGYNNGLITGMILGNMMHPHNTVVYAGGGQYNNNALLYPDGRVVNQQGYQVGTYVNGVFTPVPNGAMVAQPVPADAVARPVEVGYSGAEVLCIVFGAVLLIFLIILFMVI